jgi:hypothetical protein
MACEGVRWSESAPQPVCRTGKTAGQQSWPRWASNRVHWTLLILLVALQTADVVTTNYGLAMEGNWEANPIMAWCQARLGSAWWLPKAAVVCIAAFAPSLTERRWPMICGVSYYGVIVFGNLVQL